MTDKAERAAEFKKFKAARWRKQIVFGTAFVGVVAAGWWYPLIGFAIPACMLLGIGIGVFKGRKWCDWLCPRGSFYDAIVKPISPSKPIPQVFKRLPLRIGVMALLMTMMVVQLVRFWPDPYKIGLFFVTLLTITTVVGIVLGLINNQRTWCCICPVGSMSNWVGRSRMPLKIDSSLCTECGLCAKVCPIGVSPVSFKGAGLETVRDGDCLKCRQCVTACPVNALSFGA